MRYWNLRERLKHLSSVTSELDELMRHTKNEREKNDYNQALDILTKWQKAFLTSLLYGDGGEPDEQAYPESS